MGLPGVSGHPRSPLQPAPPGFPWTAQVPLEHWTLFPSFHCLQLQCRERCPGNFFSIETFPLGGLFKGWVYLKVTCPHHQMSYMHQGLNPVFMPLCFPQCLSLVAEALPAPQGTEACSAWQRHVFHISAVLSWWFSLPLPCSLGAAHPAMGWVAPGGWSFCKSTIWGFPSRAAFSSWLSALLLTQPWDNAFLSELLGGKSTGLRLAAFVGASLLCCTWCRPSPCAAASFRPLRHRSSFPPSSPRRTPSQICRRLVAGKKRIVLREGGTSLTRCTCSPEPEGLKLPRCYSTFRPGHLIFFLHLSSA